MAEEDIEEMHNNLMGIPLPTSMLDLKNPTEEYVMNLYKQFINHFAIELHEIMNLSMQQLDCLSVTSPENAQVSSSLNLLAAIQIFAPQLYLDNLTITELTSPTAKKTRHRIKFLINFLFFAINKRTVLLNSTDQVFELSSKIKNSMQEKDKLIERMNDKATKSAARSAPIKKMKAEWDEIKPRIESIKKNVISKESKECHALKEKKLHRYESLKKKKTDTLKSMEKNDFLQSKIVINPSEIKAKYEHLQIESQEKLKESETLQDKVRLNRPKIENLRNALDGVKSEQKGLLKTKELYGSLTSEQLLYEETSGKVVDIAKEIDSTESRKQVDKIDNNEMSKYTVEADKKMKKFKSTVANLLHEKKTAENNTQVKKQNEVDFCLKLDQGNNKVKKIEGDIEQLLIQCDKLFKSDLVLMEEMHEKIEIINN